MNAKNINRNIPDEISVECFGFGNTNSPGHSRSHRRLGNIIKGVSPVRSLYFLLLLATHASIGGSSWGSKGKSILLPSLPMITIASAMRTTASTTLRRSARLRGVSAAAVAANAPEPSSDPPAPVSKRKQRRSRSTSSSDNDAAVKAENGSSRKKTKKTTTKSNKTTKKPRGKNKQKDGSSDTTTGEIWCLPRTQEKSILSSSDKVRFVMGVDEAGRGPLAGPVVAAAAIVPLDIDGITDSKKITKEQDREDLFKAITESPKVRWAVAVMDAPFIDKVNILQATMRGMSAAATALVADAGPPSFIELGEEKIPIVSSLSIEQEGCYVITNNNCSDGNDNGKKKKPKAASVTCADDYCALVDGNRVPSDMPCEAQSIVKGDSKEYAIAAASILAKVSRDRLMRDYHNLWPHFGLEQHKGYPTAAHMQAVKTFGASPIHRMTFRPLKDMTFDKDGKVVE